MKTITCLDCKQRKSVSDYYNRNNYNKSGTVYKKHYCKGCCTIRTKSWQERNNEKYRKYMKEYFKNKKLNV